MRSVPNEVEAKFHVRKLRDLEQRILQQGGQLTGERVLETNWRLDTPDGSLKRGHRALRLRRDSVVTLTYKGPGEFSDGVRTRPELEVRVSDLEAARGVLEGLGFGVVFQYEKYRTTYVMGGVEIMLDELPYGDFVELEGRPEEIRSVASDLALRWDTAIPVSYHDLFEKLQAARNLAFRDLTFENFSQVSARIEDLGLAHADA